MIKIEVLNGNYKDKKLVLLNPAAIVSVEQIESDLYVIYLLDKRKYYMTEEMFMEHFEENEIEEYYQ
jgi:hypothetical protein